MTSYGSNWAMNVLVGVRAFNDGVRVGSIPGGLMQMDACALFMRACTWPRRNHADGQDEWPVTITTTILCANLDATWWLPHGAMHMPPNQGRCLNKVPTGNMPNAGSKNREAATLQNGAQAGCPVPAQRGRRTPGAQLKEPLQAQTAGVTTRARPVPSN